VRNAGPERAGFLLRRVHEFAARSGVSLPGLLNSDYINTIPASAQPAFPGDVAMESGITARLACPLAGPPMCCRSGRSAGTSTGAAW
jgi:pyruvate dehydrogenase complex dehydrogenase (E1) component